MVKFGFSPDNITSPGPTIVVREGDIAEIRVINVGRVRHAFTVVERPERRDPIIWRIDSEPHTTTVQGRVWQGCVCGQQG